MNNKPNKTICQRPPGVNTADFPVNVLLVCTYADNGMLRYQLGGSSEDAWREGWEYTRMAADNCLPDLYSLPGLLLGLNEWAVVPAEHCWVLATRG